MKIKRGSWQICPGDMVVTTIGFKVGQVGLVICVERTEPIDLGLLWATVFWSDGTLTEMYHDEIKRKA